MKFFKKLHALSIHALNLSAILALTGLAVNIATAVCMYFLDRKKSKAQK